MSKGIKIDFGTAGYTYDVYTSSSRTGTYTLYTSGFTGQTLTITGTPITGTELFVKTTCPHCKDQIVRVRLVPEPITLTGSTVNGTCENCGDTDEPECNGSITLYVCGGVRPFTYQWSGSTKSGKIITSTTKDLGYLEEGNYNVIVSDSYGITGTTGFTIDVAPCNPPRNLSAVAPIISTPTPTPTPTASPTPTPTPTPTNTSTPSPTPTPTAEAVNTDLYYYYRLGDCREMGYETQQITNTGFGIIRITGLCSSNITNMLEDPAHTSYYTDYTNPCGFASGYTYTVFGKSSKSNEHIPEGSVFTIGDQCLSVVWIEEQYLPGSISLISLDGLTPELGDNPCYTCQPPFTGITWNWYVFGATRCDNQSHILVYSIFPYVYDATPYGTDPNTGLPELTTLQTGLTYAMVTYNELGNVVDDGYCATITSYYGAYTGQTVQIPIQPITDPILYTNLPIGVQAINGEYLNNCDEGCPALYYGNSTEKCGSAYELSDDPIWSTVKLNTGDIIKDDNGVCRKVTYPGTFKQIKYKGYWQTEIISMVGTKYTNNDCNSCS